MTHLPGGRIGPLTVKGLIKVVNVGLGDGSNRVIKSVYSSCMVAHNTRKEASRNTVAQIGGGHSGKRLIV